MDDKTQFDIDDGVYVVQGPKRVRMTQELADNLWNIACVSVALTKTPPYKDQDTILSCLRNMLRRSQDKNGVMFPEAGFSWRLQK